MLLVRTARFCGACTSLVTTGVLAAAHSIPRVPFCDTLVRGIDTVGMTTELCATVLLTSMLVRTDDAHNVSEVRAAAHAYGIWNVLLAALARIPCSHMMSTSYDTKTLTTEFCRLVHSTREWAFARVACNAQDAAVALQSAASALDAIDALFHRMRETPHAHLVDVFRVWVQFELCCHAAGDDIAVVETFFAKIAKSDDLRPYELHAICWILDGIRGLLDEEGFVRLIDTFRDVGLTAETFESKVACACIRISALAT